MNRYRLGMSVLLLLFMLVPLAAKHAQATDPNIQLIIGGEIYQPDVPPKIVEGRTLVPIRVVAEAFGAKVDWDPKEKKVSVVSESVDLSMWIGNPKATVMGREVAMDVPPKIESGRTLVPLRFVGESLGTNVGWEVNSRSVIVNQPYRLSANGKKLEEKVFKFKNELYFPLKALSPFLGANLQTKEDKVDRLVMNHLNVALDEKGQEMLKLKKMDTGWVIPKSTLESQLQATVIENSQDVQIKRLSQLRSVREEGGKVLIDYTIPIPPKHFLMSSPNRLVIDLPNMIIGEELKATSSFNNGMGVVQKLNTVVASGKEVNGESLEEATKGQQANVSNPLLQQPSEMEKVSEGEVVVEDDYKDFIGSADSLQKNKANHRHDGLIKEIRYSQFSNDPQTVRVVVELNQKVKYDIIPTQSGYEISLKSLPKKEGFLIVLDPGHGGKDPGAVGVNGNFEKELTLSVSNYLMEELKQYKSLQVIQTRTNDTYPTLQERVQLANESGADLFLSIHGNSFKPETRGTETFYFTPQSEGLSKILHKHLLAATEFPDRGVKIAGFFVIKNTLMPSSLVELGFLSNVNENARLIDPEFQKIMAKALGVAIYEYYTSLQ